MHGGISPERVAMLARRAARAEAAPEHSGFSKQTLTSKRKAGSRLRFELAFGPIQADADPASESPRVSLKVDLGCL